MDELDEIRRDARYAQQLRDGAGQPSMENVAKRLGYDPEGAARLRATSPGVSDRIPAAPVQPPPGERLRSMATDVGDLRERVAANPQPATAPGGSARAEIMGTEPRAVPPRNVPLGTPGGPAPAGGAIQVDSAGRAGVATNPNVQKGSPSPEARAWAAETGRPTIAQAAQNATGAGSTAPAAAAQAAEAAPSVAKPVASGAAYDAGRAMGAVARTAGRIAGPVAAIGDLAMEGVDVARVAQDPNRTRSQAVEQAGIGATKLVGTAGGAMLGAQGGAALGSLAGPIGTVAGGVIGGAAGGYLGSEAAERGINALRASMGLGPRPVEGTKELMAPGNGVSLTADAKARAAAGALNGQPDPFKPGSAPTATRTDVQRTGNAEATPVQSASAPRTIGQVAQRSTQSDPQYTLGDNATQVIRGMNQTVATFGPNGPEGEVSQQAFDQGRANEARRAMVDEGIAGMEPAAVRKQRIESEGRIEERKLQEAGAGERALEKPQRVAPQAIKDLQGHVTGYSPGFTFENGRWVAQRAEGLNVPTPKPKKPDASLISEAKEAAKKNPAALGEINARLESWGLKPLSAK